MKKIYFRILAICLSLVLTFSILYKDSIQADALEWVGVAVGYDTAFKFLLGLLGVSVGVGVAENVDWGTLRENAIQVQLDQGNSQAEVSVWWNNVIHGSLDTASSCWSAFKDWIEDYTSNNSSSINGNTVNFCKSILPNINSSNIENYSFNVAVAYQYQANGTQYLFYFINASNYYVENGLVKINYIDGISGLGSNVNNTITFNNITSNNPMSFSASNGHQVYLFNFNDITYPNQYFREWILDGGTSTDSVPLEALYPNIGDIALNPENADTLSTDVIPLPWENIGTSDTAIEDIIDDAISKVNDGTMSLENYWEYVQNITNTYAYSIENNYLLPNENGEDKKADDKVKENSENGAFVLYGLEKVFPFCIPFDIYAFITLLKADPVAPVIEYPIYNPVTQENEIITIDFSEWESVVIIFRYIFDFLLIIGLLLLARPLVGAGGDS